MKKVSTATAKQTKNFSQSKLTIGLDLGDRSSWYCLLDEVGEVLLEPLLAATEALSERIYEYSQQIAKIAKESYPQVARLEQVKGVGTLIALTFLLTLEDPHRFCKSRDVGCYVGLQPGSRKSAESDVNCISSGREAPTKQQPKSGNPMSGDSFTN